MSCVIALAPPPSSHYLCPTSPRSLTTFPFFPPFPSTFKETILCVEQPERPDRPERLERLNRLERLKQVFLEPRSARGDVEARVTKWRAVPLGSTTHPNIAETVSKVKKTSMRSSGSESRNVINTMQEPRRGSQLGGRQRLKTVPRRGTSTSSMLHLA